MRRLLVSLSLSSAALAFGQRVEQTLETGWAFQLGDPVGAQTDDFDASAWTRVDLPHDWSIALPLDPAALTGGNGGFFSNGIGWYRRSIGAPTGGAGRRVVLEFEGVAGNAEVWLNGVSLGTHPYAYTPFRFDLTSQLHPGAANLLCVRVDNSAQPNARWYSGSGIYRAVRLRISPPVHLADDELLVTTTALTDQRARVKVESLVRNETAARAAIVLETQILDARGRKVASASVKAILPAGGKWSAAPELEIRRPQPWSPETPVLYRAVTRLRVGGKPVEESATDFGIRTIRVSATRGFELNGRTVKLFGGSVHHDHGVLGAAAFAGAEERKVQLLKTAGFNAVRTAHNPPSTAFLAACDRLGLLVMDEIFDGWQKAKNKQDYSRHFKEWWQRDVDAWVRRDRNHPSVVLWSAGNEMFERGNADGQRLAREISARIKALDPARPVTAGVNGLGKTGDWTQLDPLFAAFDVAGYNYELAHHRADHVRLPARIIVATESYQNEAFANWKILRDHPYVIGDFVWSALDYLGEAGIGRVFPPDQPAKKHWEGDMFPWHGAYCGDIDLTGWRKPVSHYRNIIWDRGEKLYAAVLSPTTDGRPWNLTPWSMPPALPAWTWPGHEGQPLTVEVYSRHEAVRLTLNGQVLGEKLTTEAEEFKAVFTVPYAPGELKAIGLSAGREVETFALQTAGATARLKLTLDRKRYRADGHDLVYVTVEALDDHGIWQPHANPRVTFTLEGDAALAGVGSGDLTSSESYQGPARTLFQGRALVVVRPGPRPDKITLTATAPGLPPTQVSIPVR